jgi:hypothetical protein
MGVSLIDQIRSRRGEDLRAPRRRVRRIARVPFKQRHEYASPMLKLRSRDSEFFNECCSNHSAMRVDSDVYRY